MIKENVVAVKFCLLHHGQSEGWKCSYTDARAFCCLQSSCWGWGVCGALCDEHSSGTNRQPAQQAEEPHLLQALSYETVGHRTFVVLPVHLVEEKKVIVLLLLKTHSYFLEDDAREKKTQRRGRTGQQNSSTALFLFLPSLLLEKEKK